jgi:hypothetical protein
MAEWLVFYEYLSHLPMHIRVYMHLVCSLSQHAKRPT